MLRDAIVFIAKVFMRNEKEDGTVDIKIPESMMPLVMFVAWLNDKVEGLR